MWLIVPRESLMSSVFTVDSCLHINQKPSSPTGVAFPKPQPAASLNTTRTSRGANRRRCIQSARFCNTPPCSQFYLPLSHFFFFFRLPHHLLLFLSLPFLLLRRLLLLLHKAAARSAAGTVMSDSLEPRQESRLGGEGVGRCKRLRRHTLCVIEIQYKMQCVRIYVGKLGV